MLFIYSIANESVGKRKVLLSTNTAGRKNDGKKSILVCLGMLLLVIIYVLWKARARLCRSSRFSTSPVRNSHLASSKFDLDYWLKQVDLVEAREAERRRECVSPYLELPHEEPRDNQRATASWIGDAWRQWRLIQYRQQHRLLRTQPDEQIESNPVPYRRRRFFLRRLLRRVLLPKHSNPSFFIEHSPSIIAEMRPSIVNDNLIPPPEILDIQPRRVASWPRLKSSYSQDNPTLSALQTHNARTRLLQRTSKTTTFGM